MFCLQIGPDIVRAISKNNGFVYTSHSLITTISKQGYENYKFWSTLSNIW